MFITTRSSVKLHCQVLGEGEPVVMLHGLINANLASWYFAIAPKIAQRFKVILFDLRGHGRSEKTASGYSIDSLSEDLAGVVEQLAGDSAHIVGHSYGGCIATRFALKYSAAVRSLSIVEAPLPPAGKDMVEKLTGSSIESILLNFADESNLDVIQKRPRGKRLVSNLNFLLKESSLVDDMRVESDISAEELTGVSAPTLAIYGKDSDCRPAGNRIANSVPNVKHLEIDGGHHLTMDNPAGVTQELLQFLVGIEELPDSDFKQIFEKEIV